MHVRDNLVLYSGPRSTTQRVKMTVLASDNDGENFNRSLLIWPKMSMYSSLQLVGKGGTAGFDGEVMLLFERDGGNISVVRFDPADLK